mgnify:CR=1 FL=1
MTPNPKTAMHRALGVSKEIEDAAWFVLGPGLQGKPSALDGNTLTWTAEAAAELLARLDRGTADAKATRVPNLRRHLGARSSEGRRMAASVLCPR